MEFGLKWVPMASYELILNQDGATWLRIVFKPPMTPKWPWKDHSGCKEPLLRQLTLLEVGSRCSIIALAPQPAQKQNWMVLLMHLPIASLRVDQGRPQGHSGSTWSAWPVLGTWPSTWYQVLATNYLVPSTWYQLLGTKYLGTKYVLGTKYLVPST